MVNAAEVTTRNFRAVARALSCVERGGPDAEELLSALAGRVGRARTLGVTGSPGVGKSSMVERLGIELMARGHGVAVLAVDPSSPFSHGALLGDRVRMPAFVAAGGFVRSMATRGALGGLTAATADAVDVLDAAGFDWVVVETVGVGQDEVDVASEVETVVVVTMAGLGDDVQAAKAGIMEIADVFAVNKADRPGAENQVAVLEDMLHLAPSSAWTPPIIRTSAMSGEGIAALLDAVIEHQGFLDSDGKRATLRLRRAERRIERCLHALLAEDFRGPHLEALHRELAAVGAGRRDPYAAARALFGVLQAKEKP
ncbi:MAG: methylmalonyl Co-A mutase-associated GTPase MeaB [Acidobacteria bacterium]|nr:methylmalonyl Co-A mutase-associated GTPase MeaB [Acidobacteriota bacterium]